MKRTILGLALILAANPLQLYSQGGIPVWTNRFNGPANGHDLAWAMAVDSLDNVLVTGCSQGDDVNSGIYATIKYSNTGMPLWTNYYKGPGTGSDSARAIAVDSNGNVFVTGSSTINGSSCDYATIKYSSAGVPLWTNRYNGPGNGGDDAAAVVVDSNGNVFVAGDSYGTDTRDGLPSELTKTNSDKPTKPKTRTITIERLFAHLEIATIPWQNKVHRNAQETTPCRWRQGLSMVLSYSD